MPNPKHNKFQLPVHRRPMSPRITAIKRWTSTRTFHRRKLPTRIVADHSPVSIDSVVFVERLETGCCGCGLKSSRLANW